MTRGNGYDVVSEYYSKDINKKEDYWYFHDPFRTQSRFLQSVGEPYVYHVNFENSTELENALKSIKKTPLLEPFIHPFFRFSNYIERLKNAIVNNIDISRKKKFRN